jgi:hypothetical protein
MTTTDDLRARLENKPGVIGASIITRTGRYFDFLDPQPDMIHAVDLAWGQGMTCRFGGQSLEFYSVAQHARSVSYLVPEEHAFAGLMHDAAEAYIGDMVGPLKQLCPDFKDIEKRVEAAIFAKYGIPLPMDPCIKHADLRMLRTEQRDLTAGAGRNWNGLDDWPPLEERIIPWAPDVAAQMWLHRFIEFHGMSEACG